MSRAASSLAATQAFDHLMRETAAVEAALAELEPAAAADVSFSYRIRSRDRGQWDRQLAILERLARLRLTLAQLPGLAQTPLGDMDGPAAQQFERLVESAGLSGRLERLSDRLEVLEDLYEGAVDRINDHRGWRRGHLMELIIIAVLLAEVILLLRR